MSIKSKNENTSSKFKVVDLVYAGVFSLLITVTFVMAAMLGSIPILMPATPFIAGLVTGPIFMLYSTKINRPGMVLLLGILISLFIIVLGNGFFIAPPAIITSLIGEYMMKKSEYKSVNVSRNVYSVFGLSFASSFFPIYFMRDWFIKNCEEHGCGGEYLEITLSVFPYWSIVPVFLGGSLGAFIGCTIGKAMLKKHFKKAGMI